MQPTPVRAKVLEKAAKSLKRKREHQSKILMNRILANPKTASFDVSKLRIRDNASIDEVNSLVENMALPNKRLKVEE